MQRQSHSSRAFTIIELLVGLAVAAVVLGAASLSLSRMISSRNVAIARHTAFSRAEAAATRIALDITAAARSADLTFSKVAITDAGGAIGRDELLVLMTSRRPLRGSDASPEGHLFEVQYRISATPSGTEALWRRVDTAFDDFVDGGGIASPEFRGVTTLAIQVYDGTNWFDSWDSDAEGLPHAVRFTISAQDDEGRATATTRRVVSIDRVPVPPETEEETTTPESGSTGA
jgi:type II secretion system protein J